MPTYTVAANDLEGIIIRFCPHHEASVPVIHHTFNAVYGVDLYEDEFHFIFDDVPTNGQTELYKDAPKRLKDYMITRIKTGCKLVSKSETEKVDDLFQTMQLNYKMINGKYVYFKQRQELATAIQYFLKNPRPEVPSKCMEIQFTTSRIYPSLVASVVDGLDMDDLFSAKQPVPTSSFIPSATNNHLASIATTMSTAVTGLTSQVATKHHYGKRFEVISKCSHHG